jgi:prolyl oligopeptidase
MDRTMNDSPLKRCGENASGLSFASEHRPEYPITATVNVHDRYHGVTIEDRYRWLESLESEQTRQWVQAENRVSESLLSAIPQRAWIKERLAQLWDYERVSVPVTAGGRCFFLRNDGKQNQGVLWVSDGLDSLGRLLFDPNTLRADATVALAEFRPSPQGDVVAYALSDGGTDWQTWRFRRVADDTDWPDTLQFTKYWGVSWARDGSGLFYSRYPVLPNGKGDDAGRPAVYFHQLGEAQEHDKLIYAVTDHPTCVPFGRLTEDGRYLVITLFDGLDRNGVVLQDLRRPGAAVRPLFHSWDALYIFIGSRGDQLYFLTTRDAPRSRVVVVDAQQTNSIALTTIVPQQNSTLQHAVYVGGRIVTTYLEEAHSVVRIYESNGEPVGDIRLPGRGRVEGFEGDGTSSHTFFSYSDYLTPSRIYHYDIRSNRATVWHSGTIPASTDRYVTEQVFYLSKDGTRIPMFITCRRDMIKDGNRPVMLYGYGGFNISLTPTFKPSVLVWLEMGGIYAEANLRGGGEFGEVWHEAGTLTNKQNVFDDFIAAAEYLIAKDYTQPHRLGILGRSNGGLLIGAVLTQRPDLFGAALPSVGVLDMLRYQTASANARQWSTDYGLSDDAEQFGALYSYSPYHNVREGICYPPTLITTADHDDSVAPWHSYKFAAALQASQQCSNPILIRVETRAGHGAGKPVWMQVEEFADRLAFAAKALGMSVPVGAS